MAPRSVPARPIDRYLGPARSAQHADLRIVPVPLPPGVRRAVAVRDAQLGQRIVSRLCGVHDGGGAALGFCRPLRDRLHSNGRRASTGRPTPGPKSIYPAPAGAGTIRRTTNWPAPSMFPSRSHGSRTRRLLCPAPGKGPPMRSIGWKFRCKLCPSEVTEGSMPRSHGICFACLMLSCIAGGCTPPAPPRTDFVRPVKTMVVAAGEDTQSRIVPRNRRGVAPRRAGVSGAGPVGEAAGQGRSEGRQGRSDRPAPPGRIPGPTHIAPGPARSRPRGARPRSAPANAPRNACAANRKCGRPPPASPTPRPSSTAPRGSCRTARSRAQSSS